MPDVVRTRGTMGRAAPGGYPLVTGMVSPMMPFTEPLTGVLTADAYRWLYDVLAPTSNSAGSVATLQNADTALQNQITALQTSLGALQGQINTLQGQNLDGRISALEGRMSALEGRVSTLESRINNYNGVGPIP